MITKLLEPRGELKLVRFARSGLVIPSGGPRPDGVTHQRTLTGRLVGPPLAIWKRYRGGATKFSPWPDSRGKRYVIVRLATRRHGEVTLSLPPSATEELVRLEGELAARGLAIADVDLQVSMIDRGGYFFATFAESKRRSRAA